MRWVLWSLLIAQSGEPALRLRARFARRSLQPPSCGTQAVTWWGS